MEKYCTIQNGATYTRPLSLLRPTAFNVFSATANIVDFMTKPIFMPTVKSLLQLYSVFDFNFLQSSLSVSPPALRKAQARRAYVLLMFKKVTDFCHRNNLNIYLTDLHEICSVGRALAVDERSSYFFNPSTLPWQPIFYWLNPHNFCDSMSPKRNEIGTYPVSPPKRPPFYLFE